LTASARWNRQKSHLIEVFHRRFKKSGFTMSMILSAFCFFTLLVSTTPTFAQEIKKIRLGYPSLAFTQSHLDMLAPQMPQAKSAKPDQFVDLSFLQELDKEHFFSEMARRYPSK